jgi:hypothetical protein
MGQESQVNDYEAAALAAANAEYLRSELGEFVGLAYVTFVSTSAGRGRRRPAREVEMVGHRGRRRPAREVEMVGHRGRYYSINEDAGPGMNLLDRIEQGGGIAAR